MVSGGERALQSRRVCVVGAGLVAARELRREGHAVVVMEQNRDVGGQWLYDPGVEVEGALGRAPALQRVHSSVYASLRLNLARETMGYTDFPFVARRGRDARRFPGHREVLLYLRDFCDWFGLWELVRLNTRVEYVGLVEPPELGGGGGRGGWVVRSKEVREVVEETYDAVVVATGQYSQPRMPNITGMGKWKRRQLHCHVYRVPEPFLNEVVVVVGNSNSGRDISIELVDVAKEVHVSAKSLEISEGQSKIISKHPNLHIHLQIESLHEDGKVIFKDGTWIVADSIIYCTGYSYSFPFLDTQGIVTVDDDRVGPLFEHTFPPSLAPSLSFVGIPRKIVPFPFFESQGRWIAQVLSDRRSLPSQDDMMKSVKEFYHSKDAAGVPKHKTHDIADFEYCDRYCDYSDFPHMESWRKELSMSTAKNSSVDLEGFRDRWDNEEQRRETHQSTTHCMQLGHEASHL